MFERLGGGRDKSRVCVSLPTSCCRRWHSLEVRSPLQSCAHWEEEEEAACALDDPFILSACRTWSTSWHQSVQMNPSLFSLKPAALTHTHLQSSLLEFCVGYVDNQHFGTLCSSGLKRVNMWKCFFHWSFTRAAIHLWEKLEAWVNFHSQTRQSILLCAWKCA